SEESSTRRSELPNVYPKPRSSGSMTNEPRFSSTFSVVMRGTWKSSMGSFSLVQRPPVPGGGPGRLLGVQLDDELLLQRGGDLPALGLAQHLGGERVVVGLQPRRHLRSQFGGVADDSVGAGAGLDRDHVAIAHLVRRDVDAA